MTLEELAHKTGFSWQTLQRYETEVRPITLDKLQKIADALAVPLAALVSGNEELSNDERQIIEWMRANPRDRRLIQSQFQILRDSAKDMQEPDNQN